MPHPSAVVGSVAQVTQLGWGAQPFGSTGWGGRAASAGFTTGGQVVIRHDRSTTKKKRLRQRQRMN